MEAISIVGFIRCFIDILATAFNISVVVFIYRKRAGEPTFRSCFFSLYLANSTAECVVSIALLSLFRIPVAASITGLVAAYVPCRALAITDYCFVFSAVGHCLIACNRYTCLAKESRHQHIWDSRLVFRSVSAIQLFLPLALISISLAPCHYVIINGLFGAPLDDEGLQKARFTLYACVHVTSAAIGFGLNFATAHHIFRHRSFQEARSLRGHPDVRLFLYSLCLSVTQGLFALWYLGRLAVFRGTSFASFTQSYTASFFLLLAYCSLGPVFLVALSPGMLKSYAAFYGLRRRLPPAMSSTSVAPFMPA